MYKYVCRSNYKQRKNPENRVGFGLLENERGKVRQNYFGSGGIRTHAPEETGALNQRLRPLGHATFVLLRQ